MPPTGSFTWPCHLSLFALILCQCSLTQNSSETPSPRNKLKTTSTSGIPISYTNTPELCERLTEPFSYPLDNIPRPRAVLTLLQSGLLENIVCQASIPPEVLHFCPFLLPEHPMAHRADFLSLSYVLGGILDQGRDVFTNGIISEDDYHSLWDALIRRPLVYLSQSTRRLSLDFARNATDIFQSGTLVKLARPDFLCYMQKTLILRGEEKRSAGDLEVASRELVNKLDE